MRKEIHCLKTGSLKKLDAGNGYIAYGRFDGEDCAAVVINCTDGNISLTVPVWEIGVPTGAVMTRKILSDNGFSTQEEQSVVKHGRLFVTLPAKSGCVYSYKFKS